MSTESQIITVDASNVDEHGFFCRKSKMKTAGNQQKLAWLKDRFAEGMRIKIIYEGERSVGFIEYTPGEYAWRAVEASGYSFIHCIWVVGRAKKKGYGSRMLQECQEEAAKAGHMGVAMVTSSKPWLAGKKLLLKNGFESVDSAPPTFELLVHRFRDSTWPVFPQNWDERAAEFGTGLTIIHTDQCPYNEDVVEFTLGIAAARGLEGRTVKFESSQDVQSRAPSPYGTFGVLLDGKVLTYSYETEAVFNRLLDAQSSR